MLRLCASIVALSLVLAGGPPGGSGGVAPASDVVAVERWTWPVAGSTLARPYLAPATRFGSGHRGIDLAATVGAPVVAPTNGIVVFVGRVVDRGVLTLDAGGGRVVTVEPLATSLTVGTVVAAGDLLGTVDVGGRAPAGHLHVGVRVNGQYVDPMRFFGGTPRAILLPCC